MDNKDLIDLIDHDIMGAMSPHNDQVEQVSKWIEAYDGAPLGNEDPSKSQIVWKLIRKQGESLISNLSKPFIGAHEIVDLAPLTHRDTLKTPIYSKVINHFWSKEINSNKLVKSIARLMVKEGTAFVRVGWEKNTDVTSEKIPAGIPPQMLERLASQGAEITQNEDKSYTATTTKILKNRPTAKPLRMEDVYFDPTADSFEEISFFAFDYVTSIAELRAQPHLYPKEAVDKLEKVIEQQDDHQHNSYEDTHQYNRYAFEFSDNTRKKVRLTEYWGDWDFEDNGKVVPAMALTAKYGGSERILIRMEKNKLPFNEKPFVCIPLIEREFGVYGDALASMIEDEQKFYTSIVRGIIDNMSMSNNGTKFVRKNALDSTNFQRMMDGERVVEVNTNESINATIMDGTFNQLPSDVYNTLSLIEAQSESLTGVSKFMQGIPTTEMKASSANFSAVMSQSQIRLLDMTTSLTNGLRKIFYMWISMSMEYLNDDEILNITGFYIPEMKVKETKRIAAEMQLDQLPPESQQQAMQLVLKEVQNMFDMKDLQYDVKMKVGTDGLKEIKIGQLNMLMQQAGNLVQIQAVPPQVISMLFADMADAMDRPDIAKMVETYQPQPDPMQQAMAKAELDHTNSETEKNKALAANALGRTKGDAVKTQKDAAGAQLELEGKAIDNAAKMAKVTQDETKTNADAYSKVKQAQQPKAPNTTKMPKG